MEVDHIVPFSRGGSNHVSNLTASCRKCNRKKSDKMDHRIFIGFFNKIFWGLISFVLATVLAIVALPFTKIVFNKKLSMVTRLVSAVILMAGVYYVYSNIL